MSAQGMAVEAPAEAVHGTGGSAAAVELEPVSDPRWLQSCREEWDELVNDSDVDPLFLSWEWLSTWWRHLGTGRDLAVLVARSGGRVVGIAPFVAGTRRTSGISVPTLELLGNGSAGSDYLDLVVRRGWDEPVLAAFAAHLDGRGDALRLDRVLDSSAAARLVSSLEAAGWSSSRAAMGVCPYVELRGRSFEAYLGELGAEHRYAFRRKLKRLSQRFDLRLEPVRSEPERKEALEALVRLHHLRWRDRGGSDGLHTGELLAFHDELSRRALAGGWLRLLVLRLDGRPAAALYGFRRGKTFYFYQSGFDPAYARESVGLVSMGLAIRAALEEGAQEYDLLHGDERYKFHWTARTRELVRLELFPPGARGAVWRRGRALDRSARRLARRVLPSPVAHWMAAPASDRPARVRSWMKSGLARVCERTGTDRLVGAMTGTAAVPVVLAYHRVVPVLEPGPPRSVPAMATSVGMLEAHLDWLARSYRVVSLDELGRVLAEGGDTRGLAAVTFDDGYRDVFDHAYPLLRRKGLPAAVFVVTDLVGTAGLQLHDRLFRALDRLGGRGSRARLAGLLAGLGLPARGLAGARGELDVFASLRGLSDALPQADLLRLLEALEAEGGSGAQDDDRALLPMSWEMLDELVRAGFTVGSHTRGHAQLPNESPERRRREAAGSRQALEERLGTTVLHFAYPAGRFDRPSVWAVEAAGYRFAYTTCSHRDPARPLLTIPRRMLWERSCVDTQGAFSPAVMSCQVSGVFDPVSGCRDRHRPVRARGPAPAR